MTQPVGVLLREWRERRRLSQLELSIQAEISTRHLSFVETGRSKPTSAMILRLTEHLEVPLRDRNALLLAGGYAPAYPEGGLDAPQLRAVRASLRQVLTGHEPFPAVVVDRLWTMLDANAPVHRLVAGVAPALLEPPVNVLRLSLHPDGLAPRIVNLGEWRAHLLGRLDRQARTTGDPALSDLLAELSAYPGGDGPAPAPHDVVVPLRIRQDGVELRFFSITAVFGSPLDVTVAELAIESFFPADAATAAALGTALGAA
ncbi:helix-turn-helix transcriptional regulator [Dactylosporangium sp. NPDC049742]|uniref:helix-turn-helix domain-containing protein n=1 Tax=unclassified Dactylosporangium TaxID=2621675 RepID=UPI0033A48DE2